MGSTDNNLRRDIGQKTPDGKPVRTPICRVCDERAVEHIAVVPLIVNPGGHILEPHTYGVCGPCHDQQYREKYGHGPGPQDEATDGNPAPDAGS